MYFLIVILGSIISHNLPNYKRIFIFFNIQIALDFITLIWYDYSMENINKLEPV